MAESGAGGNWKRIDEKFDADIVKQTSGLSCVSAVGEMLLARRGVSLSQRKILDIIGEPAQISRLADVLNEFGVSEHEKQWRGIVVEIENLDFLLQTGHIAVVLREPFELGHMVLVDGETPNGLIEIKDPFDQTSYKMTREEFLKHWNGEVIYYGRIN